MAVEVVSITMTFAGTAESFGTQERASFLKSLGCHHVFDCDLANDLHLAQVAGEFVERFRTAQVAAAALSRRRGDRSRSGMPRSDILRTGTVI